MLENPELLNALRHLSLEDIDKRLTDIDAERAALSSLRRSLIAREKTKRRRAAKTGVRHE